ncbi:hypothetical protein [Chitinophaga japonensis]|uniref:hypothetical protein n=1 Tax=Chitinophaga japonensis TaxID=104662 RepID=UPI0011A650D3|nr:hypothetical protein [Chitinophaga japonensis]
MRKQWGVKVINALEWGIQEWTDDCQLDGPYDTYSSAKKALIATLRSNRDEYNDAIKKASKMKKSDSQ